MNQSPPQPEKPLTFPIAAPTDPRKWDPNYQAPVLPKTRMPRGAIAAIVVSCLAIGVMGYQRLTQRSSDKPIKPQPITGNPNYLSTEELMRSQAASEIRSFVSRQKYVLRDLQKSAVTAPLNDIELGRLANAENLVERSPSNADVWRLDLSDRFRLIYAEFLGNVDVVNTKVAKRMERGYGPGFGPLVRLTYCKTLDDDGEETGLFRQVVFIKGRVPFSLVFGERIGVPVGVDGLDLPSSLNFAECPRSI